MSSKRLRRTRSLPVCPLPPQVAWLDDISMDVIPLVSRSRITSRRVDYLLSVTYQSSTWHFVRSFDQFRFFRKRLVTVLSRGHFCHAECPWLYTFLKSYFPRSQLLGSSLSRVVTRRRKSLTRSLATIRSFLLNRRNHICPLVVHGVALELLQFVIGTSQDPEHERHGQVPEWLHQLHHRWQDGDFEPEDTTSSEDTTVSEDSASEKDICAVCENSLVGYFHKEQQTPEEGDRWVQLAAAEPFSTLSCGHNFHDQCLIERLNEVLECPTCGRQET